MNKRPLSISIIGGLFIGLGTFVILANLFWLAQRQLNAHSVLPVLGYGHSAEEQAAAAAIGGDEIWVFGTELVAIVAGAFLLRGANWARWLLVAWLGFHVALSIFHSWDELAVHGLLAVLLIYFLFRAPAAEFFRGGARCVGEGPPVS